MADDASIASNFNNLPMQTLISAPLMAAADSNVRLAVATYDFIQQVWINQQDKSTRLLSFPLDRYTDTGIKESVTVNAPFAALAQLPNLMVKTVDIEFTMEVKDTSSQTDTTTKTASFDGSANYMFFSVHVSGSLSASSTNTRSTDQSAKYDVRVHAEQAPPTEGMNRLAQVFASVIEPIATKQGK